jgi:hypothetical protein
VTTLANLPPDDAAPILDDDPRLTDARTPTAHAHPYAADDHTHQAGAAIPAGIIVMWGGLIANIPNGWLLCDGQNGTPDLRDRFIKGANGNPGATGGAATHTHDAHSNHVVTQPGDHAAHTHTYTQTVNHVHVQTVNSAGRAVRVHRRHVHQQRRGKRVLHTEPHGRSRNGHDGRTIRHALT